MYGLIILFQIFMIIFNNIQIKLHEEVWENCVETQEPVANFEQIQMKADSILVLTNKLSELSKK